MVAPGLQFARPIYQLSAWREPRSSCRSVRVSKTFVPQSALDHSFVIWWTIAFENH